MAGFFGRVSRYNRPLNAVPRENRLTENFAAVLDRVERLPADLVHHWLRSDHPCRKALGPDTDFVVANVRTQRPTSTGKYIDIELRFSRAEGPRQDDVIVWVEVKHGSPESGANQFRNYLAALDQMYSGPQALVLLAPQDEVFENLPAMTTRVTWEGTGDRLTSFQTDDSVEQFLVEELINYLREEDLMSLKAIGPAQLLALAERRRTDQAIADICRFASGHMEAWKERDSPGKGEKQTLGPGYEETWDLLVLGEGWEAWTSWGERLWLWWALRSADDVLDDKGGRDAGEQPVFLAGLSVETQSGPVPWEQNGTLWEERFNVALSAMHGTERDADPDRFIQYRIPKKRSRLVRFAYPDEVLVGRTLQQQGERLAEWILETFDTLRQAGPPHGAITNELADSDDTT